jgi:hypothetical protein
MIWARALAPITTWPAGGRAAAGATGGATGGASGGPPWLPAALTAATLSASALARSLVASFILTRTYVSVQYLELSNNTLLSPKLSKSCQKVVFDNFLTSFRHNC